MRDISLSEGMSMLKLGEDNALVEKKEHQINSKAKKHQSAGALRKDFLSASLQKQNSSSSENEFVLSRVSEDSLVAPKTPSHIPILKKPEAIVAAPASPSKTHKISPIKTQFLSKDSNITGFSAWDVDARLGSIESMYADLQETIKSTTTDRSEMEKEVGIYKLKSKLPISLGAEIWKHILPRLRPTITQNPYLSTDYFRNWSYIQLTLGIPPKFQVLFTLISHG